VPAAAVKQKGLTLL